jgi:hypothetical protein
LVEAPVELLPFGSIYDEVLGVGCPSGLIYELVSPQRAENPEPGFPSQTRARETRFSQTPSLGWDDPAAAAGREENRTSARIEAAVKRFL